MTEFRADLHCHSTCSDGTFTPEQLVRHALKIGLSGLSITDHDTIEAYKTAMPLAKELGLAMVSGVEFSTHHQGTSIHILGYAFRLDNPALQELCAKHALRREDRNKKMLEKLAKLGFPLNQKQIQCAPLAGHSVGRPHIAQAMVEKGYVSTIREAFKLYLGEGKPAFVQGGIFTVEETLSVIHKAHGLAVIAHPHLVENTFVLKQLFEMDFDGIECYYSKFLRQQDQPWIDIAEKKGWLATGGSDFHGEVKPNIPLGCSWVGLDTFEKIKGWSSSAIP